MSVTARADRVAQPKLILRVTRSCTVHVYSEQGPLSLSAS